MITVFHGSNIEVSKPLVSLGRANLDFGKAFYTTDIKDQAENWSKIIFTRKESGIPIVSVYSLDIESVKKNFRYLRFEEYNQAWLDFVVDNRKGGGSYRSFDIVEGGVANDKVIDTVEAYMDGIISADFALGQLRYHKPNNQIAIINQEIIEQYLNFIRSYSL